MSIVPMFDSDLSESKANPAEQVRIFISYKHIPDDELIKDELLSYIQAEIERVGAVLWIDTTIEIGDFWDTVIRNALAQTDIAIMLVSQHYLNSPYINQVEIKELIERRQRDGMVIMPLILSPCLWKRHEWLASTQYLPMSEQTIEEHYTERGKRKRLFQQFTQALLKRIEEAKARRQKIAEAQTRQPIKLATEPGTKGMASLSFPLLPPEPMEPPAPKLSTATTVRTYTFQIISASKVAGEVSYILQRPLTATDGSTILFKPTVHVPSHVFFVLEEGEPLEYPLLRDYATQGVRIFLLILTGEWMVSPHKLDEKAASLRAEVFKKTRLQLADIYICGFDQGKQEVKGMKKLLQALARGDK